MLVNLVDINVLMLLWANLSRHLVRCMLRMLRRVISCHLQVNPAKRHVLQEHSAIRPVRVRVLTLRQDILCHLLVRRVRLHAVLVSIKHPPVKHPVMPLMLATMFRAQPKAARPLVQ